MTSSHRLAAYFNVAIYSKSVACHCLFLFTCVRSLIWSLAPAFMRSDSELSVVVFKPNYSVANRLTQLWFFYFGAFMNPCGCAMGSVYSNAYFMRLEEQRNIANVPFTDSKALSASDLKIIAIILSAWGLPCCRAGAPCRWEGEVWGLRNVGHKLS